MPEDRPRGNRAGGDGHELPAVGTPGPGGDDARPEVDPSRRVAGAATSSLLPAPAGEYVAVAATTDRDVDVLAPRVDRQVRGEVEDDDPDLDADVAAWFADDCDLPRLSVLGPLTARAQGRVLPRRTAYFSELLAFLAFRPHGATVAEVAEAFAAGRVREDVKILREWLGVNPRTGRRHLPDAREAAGARARGIPVYQVEDLLVDADLFRRLRVRGQARGADGIADLVQALRLVTGAPFEQLRGGGGAWLYEGDRIDQHLLCAVVDVAHLVTVHALHAGDLRQARWAAETAVTAAPHEEIPRLDLVAVTAAEGRAAEARRILLEEVCNRSDDGQAPPDLPPRTVEIIDAAGWLAPTGTDDGGAGG